MQKQVNVVGTGSSSPLKGQTRETSLFFCYASSLEGALETTGVGKHGDVIEGHILQGQGDTDLLSFLLLLTHPVILRSSYFYLDPAMVCRLLSLVSLCVLGASESFHVGMSPLGLCPGHSCHVFYVLVFPHRTHLGWSHSVPQPQGHREGTGRDSEM